MSRSIRWSCRKTNFGYMFSAGWEFNGEIYGFHREVLMNHHGSNVIAIGWAVVEEMSRLIKGQR